MRGGAETGLTTEEIDDFIADGFVRVEGAFSADVAKRCRDELWAEIGLPPDGPEGWSRPVVRVGFKASAPFVEAANTPVLHRAYEQLAGEGRWVRPRGLGTFPIRFPSDVSAGDDGSHIDASFGEADPDLMERRVNVKGRGRALLMLFLLSDVGEDDAPTRIRKGSHVVVARDLLPHGEAGATLRQISADGYASTAHCEEALATGEAGTVYLCHPFLVHAAQMHLDAAEIHGSTVAVAEGRVRSGSAALAGADRNTQGVWAVARRRASSLRRRWRRWASRRRQSR